MFNGCCPAPMVNSSVRLGMVAFESRTIKVWHCCHRCSDLILTKLDYSILPSLLKYLYRWPVVQLISLTLALHLGP